MAWMRLDTDFARDPKMISLIKHKNKGAAFDVIRLWAICHENYGCVDLNDAHMRDWLEESIGIRGKRLKTFLWEVAGYGLIDPEKLKEGLVTSDRLLKEGLKRQDAEQKAKYAAEQRWKGR